MITEDYVSFETAKLLNIKGFKGEFHKYYWGYKPGKEFLTENSFNPEYDYPAPTLQMTMKWLRKNYQIFIRPNISFLYPIKWYSEIFCYGDNLKTQQDIITEYYDSPEKASEAAIIYCLKYLI